MSQEQPNTPKLPRCYYCHEPVTEEEYIENHAGGECGGTAHLPPELKETNDA